MACGIILIIIDVWWLSAFLRVFRVFTFFASANNFSFPDGSDAKQTIKSPRPKDNRPFSCFLKSCSMHKVLSSMHKLFENRVPCIRFGLGWWPPEAASAAGSQEEGMGRGGGTGAGAGHRGCDDRSFVLLFFVFC